MTFPSPPVHDETELVYVTWEVQRRPAGLPWWRLWYRVPGKALPEGEFRLGARYWTDCLLVVVGPVLVKRYRWVEFGMQGWPR